MAIALRKHSTLVNDNAPPSRDQVLARYRALREISKRHHHEVLKLISGDALLRQARRLGLAQGKTLILDDMDELNYVYDLAIHTASPERSRAIDRYAKSARLAEGSDEALVLEAMRKGQFSILLIERRHETAGLTRRLGRVPPATVIDNRHFAEAIYSFALANGIMDRIKHVDLPDEG